MAFRIRPFTSAAASARFRRHIFVLLIVCVLVTLLAAAFRRPARWTAYRGVLPPRFTLHAEDQIPPPVILVPQHESVDPIQSHHSRSATGASPFPPLNPNKVATGADTAPEGGSTRVPRHIEALSADESQTRADDAADYDKSHYAKGMRLNINRARYAVLPTDAWAANTTHYIDFELLRPVSHGSARQPTEGSRRGEHVDTQGTGGNSAESTANGNNGGGDTCLNFIVIGDWGSSGKPRQLDVMRAMGRVARRWAVDPTADFGPSADPPEGAPVSKFLSQWRQHQQRDQGRGAAAGDRGPEVEDEGEISPAAESTAILSTGKQKSKKAKVVVKSSKAQARMLHSVDAPPPLESAAGEGAADLALHRDDGVHEGERDEDEKMEDADDVPPPAPPSHHHRAADDGSRASRSRLDFVVSVGDNIYETGAADEFDNAFVSRFESVYTDPALLFDDGRQGATDDFSRTERGGPANAGFGPRWFMALGNHDHGAHGTFRDVAGQVRYTVLRPQWRAAAASARPPDLAAAQRKHRDSQRRQTEVTPADFERDFSRFMSTQGNGSSGSLSPSASSVYDTSPTGRWYMPANYYSHTFRVPAPSLSHANGSSVNSTAAAGAGQETASRYGSKRLASLLLLIVLDTYDVSPYTTRVSHAQLRWLERVLREATSRADPPRWAVVVGHRPIYSSGAKHGSSGYMRKLLGPLFARYGVRAYLAGDDHQLQFMREGGEDPLAAFGASHATHVSSSLMHVVSGAGARVSRMEARGVKGHTVYQYGRHGFVAGRLCWDAFHLTAFDLNATALFRHSQYYNGSWWPS